LFTSNANDGKTQQAQKTALSGLAAIFSKRKRLNEAINATKKPAELFRDEMALYESLPEISIQADALIWWKDHEKTLSNLSRFARKYLAIQATSVASERLFSSTGKEVVTDTRRCLTGEHAEQLIFLAHYQHIVPLPK